MMKTTIYAVYNKNNLIRKKSSSGGIFFSIAKEILENKGVVFGAKFNKDWEVEHAYCENIIDLSYFLGSKYVQSAIGDSYKNAKKFLDNERLVLFTGTPCQIFGLKSFLGREYTNLITVDLVCHGVPSRMVWREYLLEVSNGRQIININFRDKTDGWQNYSLKIDFSDGSVYRKKNQDDLYSQGFLQNLYLRNSCYKCHFKGINRKSDITLADFWGVQEIMPEAFDDKGISTVLVHTQNGEKILTGLRDDLYLNIIENKNIIKYNPCIIESSHYNYRRNFFYLRNHKDISKDISRYVQHPIRNRMGNIKRLIKEMIYKR